jgi:amino acid permease
MTKTVETLDESLSRIKPKLYYVIFITCDILCLALQAAGGAISSLSTGSDNTGVDLALAGLILQVVTMLAFVVLLGDYLARYFKGRSLESIDRRLRIFLAFLSLAIILILGRCAYRVAEREYSYPLEEVACM